MKLKIKSARHILLKILHINQSDTYGGAALAAYRLHTGLLQKGVDSRLLVGQKKSSDERVDLFPQKYRMAGFGQRFSSALALNYAYLPKVSLKHYQAFAEADIVHLHNLHTGYVNYRHLPEMLKGKKVFLTLHDEWVYTGHCSYAKGCKKFQTGCGKCPHLDTYPSIKWDNTRIEWKLKKDVFQKLNPVVICPSRWVQASALHSLLAGLETHVLPHGVDLEVFHPIDKKTCRTAMGLTEDERILGFGAMDLADFRKGADIVVKALAKMEPEEKKKLKLLLLGQGNAMRWERETGVPVLVTGYLEDGPLKTLAYSCCDVFLVPSREELFGLMALEAQACGVPVIASRVGGLIDIVEEDKSGFLINPDEMYSFSNHLTELSTNDKKRELLGKGARMRTMEKFSMSVLAMQMINLYDKALS